MARLANYIDQGYVPTAKRDLALIANTLNITGEHKPALLDPCAANAVTLCALGEAWEVPVEQTFGIEINHDRYRELAKKLPEGNTLLADISLVKCDQRAFDIIYLNPPYGTRTILERWETYFLNWSNTRLKSGGVLYFVIPFAQTQNENNLSILFANYKVRQIWKTELAKFKQVVIQAVKRPSAIIPDPEDRRILTDIPTYEQVPDAPTQPTYELKIEHPFKYPRTWHTAYVSPETLATVTADRLLHHIRPPEIAHSSVIPPSPGQIPAALTASGRTIQIGANGDTRFVRATETILKNVHEPTETETKDGGRKRQRVTDEIRVPAIRMMEQDGTISTVTGQELGEMVTTNLDAMSAQAGEAIKVLYNFDPTEEEVTDVSAVNLRRKIPNSDDVGLLPAQKHMTIANVRKLVRGGRGASVNGIMGTGKTPITIGVAAIMERRHKLTHILLACPPTLAQKWEREIRITHPNENVRVFQLERIGDVDRWLREGGYGIVTSTKLSLGARWEHAAWVAGRGINITKSDKNKILDDSAGFSIPVEKRQRALPGDKMREIDTNPTNAAWNFEIKSNKAVLCPVCGKPYRDKNGNPHSLHTFNISKTNSCKECGSPAWHITPKLRRIPLAQYIKHAWKHYKKRHRRHCKLLVIADEAQEYKGDNTARGAELASVCAVADYNAGLTGTPHGGYTRETFNMFWRTNPAFRQQMLERYGELATARKRYPEDVGSKRIIHSETSSNPSTAVYSTRDRTNVREKEIPSAAPSFVLGLMQHSTFFGLADVATHLPTLNEKIVPIPLGPMTEEVLKYTDLLQQMMAESVARGSMKNLSRCMLTMLQLPENPFKPYVIPRAGGGTLTIPPLASVSEDMLLPKEEWLLKTIQAELAEHRKVLVTLQMTDTTDITPRLIDILKKKGISSIKVTVEPKKREAWLKATGRKYDVLFSHPQRIQTGLDLLDHPTIIIYQWDYSVLRMLQVAARSYRLGQTRPVRIFHTPYAETAQMAAVKLLAMKAAAHATLTGDIANSDEDEGLIGMADTAFIAQLGRMVSDEAKRRKELADLQTELPTIEDGAERALQQEKIDLLEESMGITEDTAIIARAAIGTLTNVKMHEFPQPIGALPENPPWGTYPSDSIGKAAPVVIEQQKQPALTVYDPTATELQMDDGRVIRFRKAGPHPTTTTTEEPEQPAPQEPLTTAEHKRQTNARLEAEGADFRVDDNGEQQPIIIKRKAKPAATPATDAPAELHVFEEPVIHKQQIITDSTKTETVYLDALTYNYVKEKSRPIKLKKEPVKPRPFRVFTDSNANRRYIMNPEGANGVKAPGYIVQSAITLMNKAKPESDTDPLIGTSIVDGDRTEYVLSAPAIIILGNPATATTTTAAP